MDPVSTTIATRSVYFGDVVPISVERWLTPRRSWWFVAMPLAMVGLLGWLALRMKMDWAQPYFWGSAIASAFALLWQAWVAVRTTRFRRRFELIEREPSDSTRSLAWRMWHRGTIDGRGKVEFDTGKWIELVGPGGPRTILLDVELPDIPPVMDLSEEVPVGMDGPIGPEERKMRWMQVGLFGFNLVMVVLVLSGGTAIDGQRIFVASLWTILLGIALYRLGVRPIPLGASSAAPGVVRVTRGTTTREFHRTDSVLILQQVSPRVRAWVFRTDGARAKLEFLGGSNDPGLRQLVERWCSRSANLAGEGRVDAFGGVP